MNHAEAGVAMVEDAVATVRAGHHRSGAIRQVVALDERRIAANPLGRREQRAGAQRLANIAVHGQLSRHVPVG